MRCILLATDGSKSANRAVEFAAQLAASLDAALWIVNITDDVGPPSGPLEEFSRAEHVSRREMAEAMSVEMLSAARARAEGRGARHVQIESRRGDAAQSIIELAEEKRADAIIVGKRGCGPLAGLLVGSIAQKLVCVAPVPVIVVP